jgi:hypothetical protein
VPFERERCAQRLLQIWDRLAFEKLLAGFRFYPSISGSVWTDRLVLLTASKIARSAVGEIEMIAPGEMPETQQDDSDKRKRQERARRSSREHFSGVRSRFQSSNRRHLPPTARGPPIPRVATRIRMSRERADWQFGVAPCVRRGVRAVNQVAGPAVPTQNSESQRNPGVSPGFTVLSRETARHVSERGHGHPDGFRYSLN